MGSKSKSSNSTADVSGSFSSNQAANPERSFSEMADNFNRFQSGQMDGLAGLLGPVVGLAMRAYGAHPMLEKMGFDKPYEGVLGNFQQEIKGPEPELSPYEQRLQALMQNRGMTRQDAMANQAHAMRLGTDYNRDGAVTNDEWKKYKDSGANNAPAPMHYGSMGVGGAPQFGLWSYGNARKR